MCKGSSEKPTDFQAFRRILRLLTITLILFRDRSSPFPLNELALELQAHIFSFLDKCNNDLFRRCLTYKVAVEASLVWEEILKSYPRIDFRKAYRRVANDPQKLVPLLLAPAICRSSGCGAPLFGRNSFSSNQDFRILKSLNRNQRRCQSCEHAKRADPSLIFLDEAAEIYGLPEVFIRRMCCSTGVRCCNKIVSLYEEKEVVRLSCLMKIIEKESVPKAVVSFISSYGGRVDLDLFFYALSYLRR